MEHLCGSSFLHGFGDLFTHLFSHFVAHVSLQKVQVGQLLDEVFQDDTVSVLMCFQCVCKEISYSGFDKFGQHMQKGNICYRDDRRREVLQIIAGDPNGAAEEAWSYNMCAKRYKDHFGQAVATDPDMDDSSFEWFRNVKRQGGVERILCCPEDVMRTSSCRHGDTLV